MTNDYRIGDILRNARERLGISRKELCKEICDVTTLSRIERNETTPSKLLLNTILERLGMDIQGYYPYMDAEEFAIHNLQNEIIHLYLNSTAQGEGKVSSQVVELLKRLEDAQVEKHPSVQQFLLRYQYLVHLDKLSFDQQKQILIQALSMTIPNADGERVPVRLLSNEETKAYINLANVYYYEGNLQKAIYFLVEIFKIMESVTKYNGTGRNTYVLITRNLSNFLLLQGEYERGLEVVEKGIAKCVERQNVTQLGEHLATKAEGLCYTGRLAEGLKLYQKAYCILQVVGHYDNAQWVRDFVLEHFQMDLKENEI